MLGGLPELLRAKPTSDDIDGGCLGGNPRNPTSPQFPVGKLSPLVADSRDEAGDQWTWTESTFFRVTSAFPLAPPMRRR